MITYQGYSNGYNNPMYDVQKNRHVLYTVALYKQQNTVEIKLANMCKFYTLKPAKY